MSGDAAVVKWLLQSDPAIRWQVLQDLVDAPEAVVAAERARVPAEGWGAALLDSQQSDGNWGGSTPDERWRHNLYTLHLLLAFGPDPADGRIRSAITRTRDRVTWGAYFGDSPFFEGEVEPCINGMVLAIGSYFGEGSDALVRRLLSEQQADGGWNCEAPPSSRGSFHTTICVLEGLLEYERANGPTPATSEARRRGEEYLLDRRMFKRRSTGEVIDKSWTRFAFPPRYTYDVLRGLDHLRASGREPDDRVADAVELLRARRHGNGRWPLTNPELEPPRVELEAGNGKASRWNTLRGLRVLRWAGG